MEDEDNLYAILNVSKNATEEELKQSFRRLSVLYHPDKHLDEVTKQASQQIFQKVNQAYSILSSPESRKLYDEFGMEGVHASWQVANHQGGGLTGKILEEIRRQEEGRLESFRVRASVSSALDVTAFFDDYSYLEMGWAEYLPLVKRLGMRQSFQTWIGPKTEVSVGYALETANGVGGGNSSLSVEHSFDGELSASGGLMWGDQKLLHATLTKTLSTSTMLSSRVSAQLQDETVYPALQGTVVHVMPYNIVSSLTVGVGYPKSVILTSSKAFENGESSMSLQLTSQSSPLLSLSTLYRIDKSHALKLKLKSSADYSKVILAVQKRWSPLYDSEAGLHLSEAEGVVLKISVTRDNDYKLSVPLHLSEGMSASSILVGAALPVIFGFLTDRLIVKPYKRFVVEGDKRAKMEAIRSRVAAEKAEAELAVMVLQEAYEKKREAEERSNGLVIVEASYGSDNCQLDVKIPLQVLVSDEVLKLPGSSKSHLVGFYNVEPGSLKRLVITYKFKGKLHKASVADHEALLIPQRDHLYT